MFQPFKEIKQSDENKAYYGKEFSDRYYIFSGCFVYHAAFGPISMCFNYYDQADIEEVKNARRQTVEAFIAQTEKDQLGWYIHVEPLTSIFGPAIGPNFHRWLQRVKMIFDPKDIMNPNKLIKMDR